MRVDVSSVARPRSSMRFRGRTYMAFALTPEPPIADWLADIDDWIGNSAGYFVGRPVVLDLAAVRLSGAAVAHLIAELAARDIRVMGLEGADPAQLGPNLPPLLRGGRAPPGVNLDAAAREPSRGAQQNEPASLLLESPVRSGQSVVFPGGDVTVLGAIASGAEVVAGGSIHVYGTLRGRALAGSGGNSRARIFCHRLEAELIAIDGYYRTSEDLDPELFNRSAQAWLDGQTMTIAALD